METWNRKEMDYLEAEECLKALVLWKNPKRSPAKNHAVYLERMGELRFIMCVTIGAGALKIWAMSYFVTFLVYQSIM